MQDKEFAAILQDEPMQPLALEPLTEEEQVSHTLTHSHSHTHTYLFPPNWYSVHSSVLFYQRNFSMSVNSVAVMRLMGKGGGVAPAGMARGRGTTRGGGRGEKKRICVVALKTLI